MTKDTISCGSTSYVPELGEAAKQAGPLLRHGISNVASSHRKKNDPSIEQRFGGVEKAKRSPPRTPGVASVWPANGDQPRRTKTVPASLRQRQRVPTQLGFGVYGRPPSSKAGAGIQRITPPQKLRARSKKPVHGRAGCVKSPRSAGSGAPATVKRGFPSKRKEPMPSGIEPVRKKARRLRRIAADREGPTAAPRWRTPFAERAGTWYAPDWVPCPRDLKYDHACSIEDRWARKRKKAGSPLFRKKSAKIFPSPSNQPRAQARRARTPPASPNFASAR